MLGRVGRAGDAKSHELCQDKNVREGRLGHILPSSNQVKSSVVGSSVA